MKAKCEACGAEFESKRTAYFCSNKCRQRAHREGIEESAAHWRAEAERWKREALKPKPAFQEVLEAEKKRRLSELFAKYPGLSEGQRLALEVKAMLAEHAFLAGFRELEWMATGFFEAPNPTKRREPTKLELAFVVLGLRWPTTKEAATQAYRAKARELHPDLNPAGADKMKDINAAFAEVKEFFAREQPGPGVGL